MRYSDSERRERFALARRFRSSNLTKAEYCRRHGLSVNVLNYWLREASKEESGVVEAAFFALQVADSPSAPPARQPDLEVEEAIKKVTLPVVIERSLADVSFLAGLCVDKICHHLPL